MNDIMTNVNKCPRCGRFWRTVDNKEFYEETHMHHYVRAYVEYHGKKPVVVKVCYNCITDKERENAPTFLTGGGELIRELNRAMSAPKKPGTLPVHVSPCTREDAERALAEKKAREAKKKEIVKKEPDDLSSIFED